MNQKEGSNMINQIENSIKVHVYFSYFNWGFFFSAGYFAYNKTEFMLFLRKHLKFPLVYAYRSI